jgi:signal transduction histidine kinase
MLLENHPENNSLPFLNDGGEMGELIRSIDWNKNSLGSPALWPVSLKQTVSMMQTITFPVLICWGEDYIQLYNDAFRPMLGKGKHPKAMGLTASETFAEIWDTISPMFSGVMEGKAVGFTNFMVPLDRNGYMEDCYFDFSYSPIRDEFGQIGGVLVICMETTEKILALKRLEQAATETIKANAETKSQRDRLKRFFMQAPAGICILDGPDLIFELVNPVYQAFFPGRELIGKPVLDALPEIKGQPIWDILQDVYHSGHTYEGNELMVPLSKTTEGPVEERYFNFIYQAQLDESGIIDGILVFVIEVTESVLTRRKIEERKNDFIGMASHELKTPLTSLSGIVQLLASKLKNSDDEFLSTASERAYSQIKRMTNLINSFLNVSRLESGKMSIQKETFDLEDLIREIIEETAVITSQHEIKFEGGCPVLVNADRNKIGSVLSNLLSNASKYSPNGKDIWVHCGVENNMATVSVKDQGIGILTDDMAKIFDRYYRVETNSNQFISGFGIGLYLCYEIISQHEGKIWVDSEKNNGSIFYFSLKIHGSLKGH